MQFECTAKMYIDSVVYLSTAFYLLDGAYLSQQVEVAMSL